jgi:hypothetical protein
MKKNIFKQFRDFLNEKCAEVEMYKKGKYDRRIYNWFKKHGKS